MEKNLIFLSQNVYEDENLKVLTSFLIGGILMSSSEKKCFKTELIRENTVPGKTGNERKHGQLAETP